MLFQQIRNATIKFRYQDVCILIDPWLTDEAVGEEREQALATKSFIEKPVAPLPVPVEEVLSGVDCCLVTHIHEDHFLPDYLPKDLPLICQNAADAGKVREMGFTDVSCFEEDERKLGSVTCIRVDGRHGDTDEIVERMGKVSGFILSAPGEKTVYVAGDTIFYEGVAEVIGKYRPDAAVVNCCDAFLISRLLMDAEDVVKTCEAMKGGTVIASHMGAVSHARLTREELAEYLKDTPYAEQVLIPEDGAVIEL